MEEWVLSQYFFILLHAGISCYMKNMDTLGTPLTTHVKSFLGLRYRLSIFTSSSR